MTLRDLKAAIIAAAMANERCGNVYHSGKADGLWLALELVKAYEDDQEKPCACELGEEAWPCEVCE